MKVNDLVNGMSKSGVFGAGRLAKSVDIIDKMSKDKDCTVFFGLAGAMVPGGMKEIIIGMLEKGLIDVFVTTGANLTHDLIEAIGFRHYQGSCSADDKELHKKGIDRIYESYMPNEAYEKTLSDFTERLLADDEFRRELRALHEDVSWFGALNSLSQLVLKLTAPGIPDVYQGNESWLYALVDPDNRRPVDFQALAAQLASLPDPITPASATELLRDWPDGRIKMHVTRAGLQLRRSKLQLMANGDYLPIGARGHFARNVVAFARRREHEWVLTITGRFYSQVARAPLGAMWGDTALELPADAPRAWTNLLTGEVSDGSKLEGVLATLPFALLVATA